MLSHLWVRPEIRHCFPAFFWGGSETEAKITPKRKNIVRTSWWFFTNPSEKYAQVKMESIGSFPQIGMNITNIFKTTIPIRLPMSFCQENMRRPIRNPLKTPSVIASRYFNTPLEHTTSHPLPRGCKRDCCHYLDGSEIARKGSNSSNFPSGSDFSLLITRYIVDKLWKSAENPSLI